MNHEEQILEILVQIQAEQKKTNERLAVLEAGQVKLQEDVSEIKSDIKYLWEDVERISDRLNVQENIIEKKIM